MEAFALGGEWAGDSNSKGKISSRVRSLSRLGSMEMSEGGIYSTEFELVVLLCLHLCN